MELTRLTTLKQLDEVKNDWARILSDNENSNPFIEFEWVFRWMKHIGTNKQVEIIAVKSGEDYIGFFPFLKRKQRYWTRYEMMGAGQSNYMDFIVPHDRLDEILPFVLEKLLNDGKQNIFTLHGILESSPTYATLANLLGQNGYKHSIHKVVTPYVNLEKIQMHEYMDKRKKLHRLERREKRLHLLGQVEHKVCETFEMDVIFQLHDKRWEKKNDTSGFTDEANRPFFNDLTTIRDGRLKTIVDALFVDGKMIAFNYGFQCGNRYLSYVLGYDDEFDSFSPGRMLEKESIAHFVSNENVSVFDLSIGYEPYKFEWCTHLDYTAKFIFSSKKKRASIGRLLFTWKEEFIDRLKQSRKIVLFKRNTLGYLKYTTEKWLKGNNRDRKKTLYAGLLKIKSAFWKKEKTWIMKKEVERARKPGMGVGFVELKLKDAISNKRFTHHSLKLICTKMYGGYQAYCRSEGSEDGEIIWTNRKVLRLETIPYIKELRKNAIWVEGWNEQNLADICRFVSKEHLIHSILLEVDPRETYSVSLLQEAGFQLEKPMVFTTRLGRKKVV
ncbi:CelD/BcsL family acetyltransferase involved in cellulose biosynthesis [Sporosarcina luteola]|nr:CelD/BcsL family acetyltransferase involved in cellulose biosynthesis [Sporosarcina luteola]